MTLVVTPICFFERHYLRIRNIPCNAHLTVCADEDNLILISYPLEDKQRQKKQAKTDALDTFHVLPLLETCLHIIVEF